MRVLRVSGGLDARFGGPTLSTVLSSLAAQRAGIAVTLAFPVDARGARPAPDRLDELQQEGVEIRVFELTPLFGARGRRWGASLPLAGWLVRHARAFDLVHVHGAWTLSTVAGLLAAKLQGRPAVLSPHESLTEFDLRKSGRLVRTAKRLLRSVLLASFDLVVFASELERDDSVGRGRRHRILVLAHPILPAGGEPHVSAPAGGELRLGYLGRLDPKKNLDVLVDALALLPSTVSLVVAGDGPPAMRAWLLRRLAGPDLADRVQVLGFVSDGDKPAFFRSIDLLVAPSAYECFGMAAAEALSAGVPVMVSPQTGIAELVRSNECGFVVEPDPHGIAMAVLSLLEDGEELHRRAQRAGHAARSELSMELHGDRLRRAYASLTVSDARPRAPEAEITEEKA